jgi:hypothetical protein
MILEKKIVKDLAIFRGFSNLLGKYLEFWNHVTNFEEANPSFKALFVK